MTKCEHDNIKIFITCNHSAAQIIQFLHKLFLSYTPVGSATLEENYDKYMILAGDFNINFASEDANNLYNYICKCLIILHSQRPLTVQLQTLYLQDIQTMCKYCHIFLTLVIISPSCHALHKRIMFHRQSQMYKIFNLLIHQ